VDVGNDARTETTTMTCMHCGRYAPPCRETGYDADDLCPSCRDEAENTPEPPYDEDVLEEYVD
jgi:hypothetical protein